MKRSSESGLNATLIVFTPTTYHRCRPAAATSAADVAAFEGGNTQAWRGRAVCTAPMG